MISVGPSGEKFVLYLSGETEKTIVRQVFELALENNSGNRFRTAKSLGISIRTVRHRIKQWELGSKSHFAAENEKRNNNCGYPQSGLRHPEGSAEQGEQT